MPGAWESIKELHRTTTLGAKEGVAFRYFSRPLASFILYFIRNSRITPNQVTIASLLEGLVGALVHISFLSFWGLVVAIPALAGYAVVRNKIDALTAEATLTAEDMVNQFRPRQAERAAASAPSPAAAATS